MSIYKSAQYLARRNDPPTSKMAAEEMVESGRADTQRDRVLAILKANPEKTARELSDLSGMDYFAIQRRIGELEKLNLAARVRMRPCSITNRMMTEWIAL